MRPGTDAVEQADQRRRSTSIDEGAACFSLSTPGEQSDEGPPERGHICGRITHGPVPWRCRGSCRREAAEHRSSGGTDQDVIGVQSPMGEPDVVKVSHDGGGCRAQPGDLGRAELVYDGEGAAAHGARSQHGRARRPGGVAQGDHAGMGGQRQDPTFVAEEIIIGGRLASLHKT